jgi:hypothetical protein
LVILGIAHFSLVNPKTIKGDSVLGVLAHVVPIIAYAVVFSAKSDGVIDLAGGAAHLEGAAGYRD